VNKQVIDIDLVLKAINEKIDSLTSQLDIANTRIAVLEKENASLRARL